MHNPITEALLEMHFHQSMVDLFSSTYGLNYLSLYKPSPQREAWVGFDQAWVRSEFSYDDFLRRLSDQIASPNPLIETFYLAYFFQFKSVEKIIKNSTLKPANYSTPYYRSKISTQPNKYSMLSQHDTLRRISILNNSCVYYASGMMFDHFEVYEPVDLNKLRFVPISNSPNLTPRNKHFITFQTIHDPNPNWCSDPIPGTSLNIFQLLDDSIFRYSPQELYSFLQDINEILSRIVLSNQNSIRIELLYPECFHVLEFTRVRPLEII